MGHDIYLEKTPNHSGFHYHEDGFSWEIFYQTGDDLTLFIPLCDLNKETGGDCWWNTTRNRVCSTRSATAFTPDLQNFASPTG